MKRVFYFTDSNILLRRSHVFNIVKTSEQLGKKRGVPTLISAIWPKKMKENTHEEANAEIIKTHSIEKERVRIYLRHRGMWQAVSQLLKIRREFDVFYFRAPRLFPYFILAKLFGKKTVIEIHRESRKWWEVILWDLTMVLVDHVIFITYALSNKYNRYKRKSSVVFCNTYDPGLFSEARSMNKEAIRQKINLPIDKKLVIYTGNTTDYKFNELFSGMKGVEALLVIVGVTNKEHLEHIAKISGQEEKILLLPRVDRKNIPFYMMAADVLVVPYVRSELGAFPVKIYEYMATGNPIASFSSECIREVLRDGENGILIDPPDASHWGNGIQELLSNDVLVETLTTAAKKEAQRYTWEKRGEQITHILETL